MTAGLGIYDTMQLVHSDVATICTGQASHGSSTAGLGNCRKTFWRRRMHRVMIHQPVGGVEGQAADMAIAVKEILELQEQLYQVLSEHTGKSLDQIRKDADRDFWMRASDAVSYGIIDEVLKKSKK